MKPLKQSTHNNSSNTHTHKHTQTHTHAHTHKHTPQSHCDDVIVTSDKYALWLPCHRAGLFGVAHVREVMVREHVWHPVDLGSSPGRVTLLSLRYKPIHTSGMARSEVR